MLNTIFYKGSGIFNETLLTLSPLAYNIFPKNWFLFLDKSQLQKIVNFITCFFGTVKKQKFRNVHSWNPPFPYPLFPELSFSKCSVFVFCFFTPFLSVLLEFHRKNLLLLHLMNRCTASTS